MVMKVYTFRTSPTNDGIYLQGLSSSIVGVGNLINTFFNETYIDRKFSSIQLVGNRLLVWYVDLDTLESEYLYYDLVSFEVD